jgi:hypothetical protein
MGCDDDDDDDNDALPGFWNILLSLVIKPNGWI